MQIAGEVIQLGLGAQGCSVTRCQLEAEGGQDRGLEAEAGERRGGCLALLGRSSRLEVRPTCRTTKFTVYSFSTNFLTGSLQIH